MPGGLGPCTCRPRGPDTLSALEWTDNIVFKLLPIIELFARFLPSLIIALLFTGLNLSLIHFGSLQ